MERIRTLVNKLKQQLDEKAAATELLGTVNMLQAELAALCSSAKQPSSSKVAVVLPSALSLTPNATVAPASVKEQPSLKEAALPTAPPPPATPAPEKQVPRKNAHAEWLFDPVEEVPTLAHQKEIKELNDVIGQNFASLNDRLKTDTTEILSLLKEGPVKDLKKAIGINDRFIFLNELFRGDEAMYERSLKTINNFRVYSEAEYWIERELKVKLGWDEGKATVKQFHHLVRRRFL